MKLWKVSERDKREVGFNTREDNGVLRDYSSITSLKVRYNRRPGVVTSPSGELGSVLGSRLALAQYAWCVYLVIFG